MLKKVNLTNLYYLIILSLLLVLSCSSKQSENHSNSNSTDGKSYSSSTSKKEMYLAYVITMKIAQVFYIGNSAAFYVNFTDKVIKKEYGLTQNEVVALTKLGVSNNWESPCEPKQIYFSPCTIRVAELLAIAKQENKFPEFSEIRALAKSLAN